MALYGLYILHSQHGHRDGRMTRLMALDVGDVRIGVALSDATRLLASPLYDVARFS